MHRPNQTLKHSLNIKFPDLSDMQMAMLNRVATKQDRGETSKLIGEIFPLAFNIPAFPTELVWTLKINKANFRFYPTEEQAMGGRMLHNVAEPDSQVVYGQQRHPSLQKRTSTRMHNLHG